MSAALLLLVPALLVVGVGFLCISEWHSQEADYWSHVALLVRLDPTLDREHRPDLEWAQARPPTLWARLHAWQSPRDRRLAAQAGAAS